MTAADLDRRIRLAHRRGDGAALAGLCAEAAEGPAAAFWLTQAWVHAMEAGDARAGAFEARLRALGAME